MFGHFTTLCMKGLNIFCLFQLSFLHLFHIFQGTFVVVFFSDFAY